MESTHIKQNRRSERLRRRLATAALIVLFGAPMLSPMPTCAQQNSTEALMEEAGKAFDAGDAVKAIELYKQLLGQSPNLVEARIDLGAALAHEGRYEEAATQDREALARSPHNPAARLNLALAYYKMSDFAKARDQFAELHKLDPQNKQTSFLLADCDERMGLFKDAIALLEPAYETHPEDPALEYLLGNALIQDGQIQQGAAVIDRIMRGGNPDVANVLLGASRYAAKDYKDAAAILSKALEHNPQLPGAWTVYGQALLNNGENEKAQAALEKAVRADPNDFDACLHLGAVLRHNGDLEKAEPLLQHALTLRPASASALFQVSALAANQGQFEKARGGFEKLIADWPNFVEAHVQLATVYARLHRTADSERERKIVVELNAKDRVKGPQPEAIP